VHVYKKNLFIPCLCLLFFKHQTNIICWLFLTYLLFFFSYFPPFRIISLRLHYSTTFYSISNSPARMRWLCYVRCATKLWAPTQTSRLSTVTNLRTSVQHLHQKTVTYSLPLGWCRSIPGQRSNFSVLFRHFQLSVKESAPTTVSVRI